jgi:hypothetical protein
MLYNYYKKTKKSFVKCVVIYKNIISLQRKTIREFSSVGSEHLPYKQGVTGSTPVTPTIKQEF